MLSSETSYLIKYKVILDSIKFSNWRLYNDNMFEACCSIDSINTTSAEFGQDSQLYYQDMPDDPEFSQRLYYLPYAITLNQSSTKYKSKATRKTLLSIFRSFGSFLSFVIRFTGYIIGSFQKSSL